MPLVSRITMAIIIYFIRYFIFFDVRVFIRIRSRVTIWLKNNLTEIRKRIVLHISNSFSFVKKERSRDKFYIVVKRRHQFSKFLDSFIWKINIFHFKSMNVSKFAKRLREETHSPFFFFRNNVTTYCKYNINANIWYRVNTKRCIIYTTDCYTKNSTLKCPTRIWTKKKKNPHR